MALDEEAWAEIARLWGEGREPVATIAARFSVSHQKVVATARARGWPKRPAARPARKANRATAGAESNRAFAAGGVAAGDRARAKRRASSGGAHGARRRGAERSQAARRQMVDRLFEAVDVKLRRIEQRMADEMDESSADSERTARSLNTLIRSFEKLSAFEQKLERSKPRGEAEAEGGRSDTTERRRQELARRLAKLLERG